MKNKDKLNKTNKREPRNIKDLIPPSSKEPRINNHIKIPDDISKLPQRNFVSPIQPVAILPEWPSSEEIKNFNFFKEIDEIYNDPDHNKIFLPISFLQDSSYQIKWIRLQDLYLENILTKEIFIKYPFRNVNKIKKFLIQTYNEANCPIKFKTFENSDEFNINDLETNNTYSAGNKKLFKHFFKLFDPNNIKIVSFYERKETDEEVALRVEAEEKALMAEWKNKIEKEEQLFLQNNANKKNLIKPKQAAEPKPPVFDILKEPINKKEIIACNISMLEKYSDFAKWVGSVLQSIKDLNITDMFDKIYPQKDGIPVINPKGLYWVKLYHMGKPRKIVIDDLIPCTKSGEGLIPRTENSEEMWPAIITKALLKLFSYKFKSILYSNQEIGDLHIINALTGYIPEQINFDKLLIGTDNLINKKELNNDKIVEENKFAKIQEILKSQLAYYASDECFFFKKHFIMIYNHTPLADLFDLEKPLYNHSPKQKNKIGNSKKILMMEANTNDNKKLGRTKTPKYFKIEEENENSEITPRQKEKKQLLNLVSMDKISAVSAINEPNYKLNNNNTANKPKKQNIFQKFIHKRKKDEEDSNKNIIILDTQKTQNNEVCKLTPYQIEGEQNFCSFKDISNLNLNNIQNNVEINLQYQISEEKLNLSNTNFIDIENKKETNFNLANNNNNTIQNNNDNLNNDKNNNEITKNCFNRNSTFMKFNDKQDLIADYKYQKSSIIKNFNSLKNSTNANTFYKQNRQTIMNLFKVEKSDSMFFRKPSIILNNQIESQISQISKENNSKENEKLESQVLIDCAYPLLDIFDNLSFNLKRIKPLDMDDLKKKILGKKICYKQLSREDKKQYINNIMELKNKQKEFKNKKIEELKSNGKRYFCVKLINGFYGVEQFKFYFPLNEQEIAITKKCLLNKWNFPPYDYLEKLTPPALAGNISEIKEGNEEDIVNDGNVNGNNLYNNNECLSNNFTNFQNKISHNNYNNNNVIEAPKKDLMNAKQQSKTSLYGLNNNKNSINNHHNSNNFASRKNLNNIKNSQNLLRSQSPSGSAVYTDNRCSSVNKPTPSGWPKDIYMELINNNVAQYENPKEPLDRDPKSAFDWILFEDFFKNFNNMIIMHSTKNFNNTKEIDCNWRNADNDMYKSQDDSKVIYINTNNASLISLGNKEKEKNEFNSNSALNIFKDNYGLGRKNKRNGTNNIKGFMSNNIINNQKIDVDCFFENVQDEVFSEKTITLLIEYTANFDINGYFKDCNFYIIFDLYKITKAESLNMNCEFNNNNNTIDNNNKFDDLQLTLVKENILLKGFYSTLRIDDLKAEEEYLLFIKGGLNPLGYYLKLHIDKGIFDSMNYSKYLCQYEKFGFALNNFKIEIPNCLPNSPYMLVKLKALISTNNIKVKFDFNIEDVYLSQFFDLFLVRTSDNKLQNFKEILFSEIINLEFENKASIETEENNENQANKEHEVYFVLILNSPFFVPETSFELEILTDSPGSITIENIENIQPFEVKDSLIVSRDNHIFKELIYSSEKVFTTFFIEVKKSKGKILYNSNLKRDLNNSNNLNITKQLAENFEEENKPFLMSTNYENQKEKEPRLRLSLEISNSTNKIYKTDFFESIIIPNIIFEGIPYPSQEEQLKTQKKTGKNEKEKKTQEEIQITENSKEKENIPYSIICTIDTSEAPSWIKTEEIEWSIRVFSSDSLAFVKDTSKEQFEKSLKDNWEIAQPGRALKAKTNRLKFVLENKFSQNEDLNKEEVKFLDYFKLAEGNFSKIAEIQHEELNKNNAVFDTNNTQDNNPQEKNKNNTNKKDDKKNKLNNKKKNDAEKKNKNSAAENLNNTKDQSLIQTNPNVNTNESVNLISIKEEIINANNANNDFNKKNTLSLSPNNYVDNWNFFKSLTSRRMIIKDKDFLKSPQPKSIFIKDFIGYVEEDRTKIIKDNMIETNENYNRTRGLFFNEKKADHKLSKSTGLSEFFDRNKIKIQFDLNTIREKQDKNIKTFFQKTNFIIKNIKNEKNRLMKIREDFRVSFNSTKDTEAKIFELLESDKDGLNLEQVILMYKQIVVTEHKSATISKIHNIISKRKEESIAKLLAKNSINKDMARKFLEEIRLNKWDISSSLIRKINDILSAA